MAVKIWDSAAGAFTEAATPKVWDSAAGAYGDSTGLVYDAGLWEERWKTKKRLYVYNGGNEYADITGGWNATNFYYIFNNRDGYWERGSTYLYVKCTNTGDPSVSNSTPSFGTANRIDLSGYTKIGVVADIDCTYMGNTRCMIYIVPNKIYDWQEARTAIYALSLVWSNTRASINAVFDFNEETLEVLRKYPCYIFADAHSSQAEIKLYSLWFE